LTRDELEKMRRIYAAKMRQLLPGWDTEVEEARVRLDLLEAIHHCTTLGSWTETEARIQAWMNGMHDGKFPWLAEMLGKVL
jgi:hypothetical protein